MAERSAKTKAWMVTPMTSSKKYTANAPGKPRYRHGAEWMMKMRSIMTRISMWPASMLANRRTERETRRMNWETYSRNTINPQRIAVFALKGGRPDGIQLPK